MIHDSLMVAHMPLDILHELDTRLRICIIGNQAFSLLNFRGQLISDMVEKGYEVLALAPVLQCVHWGRFLWISRYHVPA